ncbi:hypothetical protein ABPG72_003942 [Tetrahymena utriculariae]
MNKQLSQQSLLLKSFNQKLLLERDLEKKVHFQLQLAINNSKQYLKMNNKNKYNLKTYYVDLPINQYQMPTEASQQYSPNANERSGNISPFLFQSSSRNSSQFPLISAKNNNHRINSSFSKYKVASPHSYRNNIYFFQKEDNNSSNLQQSGEALKKENPKLLNSKFTRQHTQIINSIRKRSMLIDQSMKETDDSFQQICKSTLSVQIKLIYDFQNILSVFGAWLN